MTHSYNRKFYRKTGYKITEDVILDEGASEDFLDTMEELGTGVKTQPALYENEVRKYIRRFPKKRPLWNYLYVCLKLQKKDAQAEKVLNETIEKFPNYLFGKTNKAALLSNRGEHKKALQLLGESLDLRDIILHRDVYHFTEFTAYYTTVVQYALDIENSELAEEKHRLLFEYDPEHPEVRRLASMVVALRMKGFKNKVEEQKKFEVESFPTVKFQETSEPPKFENELVRQLYQQSEEDFPEILIKEFLQLPRESFIQDLEKVLKDSIIRYKFFLNQSEEWDENEGNFPIHALYFLSALEAKESLDTILKVLRQGEEFLDYWYMDAIQEYFLHPIFFIGKDQLPILNAYLKESNQLNWARLAVTWAISQIALHEPERRAEVLDFFRDVYQYHLAHPEDETIIDGTFLAFSVGHLINIRAVELLPIIKQLYEKGWIPKIIQGDINEIEKLIKRPADPGEKQAMPKNIYEFYNDAYLDRQVQKQSSLTLEDIGNMVDPYNDYLMRSMLDVLANKPPSPLVEENNNYYDDYEVVETFKRETPKLGRNDPCHCGSGKKYKKCCLKKDKAAGRV